MKISFKEYLNIIEGGMVADDKAEEGKSKPAQRPSTMGAKSMQVKVSGVAGGKGGGNEGGGMAGGAAQTAPTGQSGTPAQV
jgi:hypothetical protein